MNETVLITGASKGFGECLAVVFAKNGFDLIMQGRNKERLNKVLDKLKNYNVKCSIVEGDLRNEKTLNDLYNLAKENNISVLINNAAMVCPGLSIDKLSFEQIDEMICTNLIAPIKLAKLIYPLFQKNNSGTIININSIVGLEHKKNRTLYAASKWGLRGFGNSLRLEAKENGINVINVYLSKMMTEPADSFGMDPMEVAGKVYKSYKENNIEELIIDGRPPEFRPK